jgi:hypothetical protein
MVGDVGWISSLGSSELLLEVVDEDGGQLARGVGRATTEMG